MKTKVVFYQIAFIVMLPLLLNAQEKIEVKNERVTMSKGTQPIPDAKLESVKKDWMKLIRQNTKSKVVELGSEISIKGTLINEICNKPINIYSAIVGEYSVIRLVSTFEIDSVFFELNETNSTMENDKKHNSIKDFMRNFAVDQYKNAVKDQVDNEENMLGSLNNEFKALNKQVEADRKEIIENEQEIKNAQDAIASYEKENERKMEAIDAKKEANEAIKDDPELRKIAKTQLKELQKEKISIENNLEKEQKDIVKYQTNIEELNRAIENNLKLIEEKKTEITNQENIVKQVNTKLNGIK
jgi:hypothetical protein